MTNGPAAMIGFGSVSQEMFTGGSLNRTPIVPLMIWFTGPYWASNMFRQTVATMIGGIATGRM